MGLDIRQIEQLAPDQASLTAAGKLRRKEKWPVRGHNGGRLLWGECQGSGANPYRAMADLADLGYKCTCPSRKFPCKHVLGLMWLFLDRPNDVAEAAVPPWVSDWVGRRKPKTSTVAVGKSASALTADLQSREKPEDAEAAARRADAAQRSKLARHEAILAGLDDSDRWLLDVFAQGLGAFFGGMHDRCRTLARRLVDAKAPALAGRVDQLPATLLERPPSARPAAALEALGQLHLLAEAYRRLDKLPAPLAADVRRLVGIPTKKEDVLEDPAAARVEGSWMCFGARTEVQADHLQRVESWFVRVDPGSPELPRFAVLIDHHPSTAGRVVSPFLPEDRMGARLVFYPSACPLRALIAERDDGRFDPPGEARRPEPFQTLSAALEDYRARTVASPWLDTWPVSAGPGAIALAPSGDVVLTDGAATLPVAAAQQTELKPLAGLPVRHALGLWDGWALTVLWADTAIGPWSERSHR